MFRRLNLKSISVLALMILLIPACASRPASAKSASLPQATPGISDQLIPLAYVQGLWLPGVPPNGSWQVEISSRDILQMGMMQSNFKNDWEGKYTLTFSDGNYTITWQDPQGNVGQCQAGYAVDKYVVRLTYMDGTDCSHEIDYFLWRIDGDELHLHLLGVENASFVDRLVVFNAKVWTRVNE